MKRSLEQAISSIESVENSVSVDDSLRQKISLAKAAIYSAISRCEGIYSQFVVASVLFQTLVTFHYYSNEDEICSEGKVVNSKLKDIKLKIVPNSHQDLRVGIMNGVIQEDYLGRKLPIVHINEEDGGLLIVTELKMLNLSYSFSSE
jgi:hypothetical protein